MSIKRDIKKFFGISETKIDDLNKRIDERILEAKSRKKKKVTKGIIDKSKAKEKVKEEKKVKKKAVAKKKKKK